VIVFLVGVGGWAAVVGRRLGRVDTGRPLAQRRPARPSPTSSTRASGTKACNLREASRTSVSVASPVRICSNVFLKFDQTRPSESSLGHYMSEAMLSTLDVGFAF
jgi:hypothetical protein